MNTFSDMYILFGDVQLCETLSCAVTIVNRNNHEQCGAGMLVKECIHVPIDFAFMLRI